MKQEEKKKRVRATWTMVRELEKKLEESNRNSKSWLESYKYAIDKISILEKSNTLMEQELDRVRQELDVQKRNNTKHLILWQKLKNRSFWNRLFNKDE